MTPPRSDETVRVALAERSYDIRIGSGLLDDPALFAALARPAAAMIVTDDIVGPLLAGRVRRLLEPQFSRVLQVTLPWGEANKRWESVAAVIDALAECRADRKSTLVALGGGVVGDLAGFAAACYMRGIDCVQVPTTLLAQVDSSVGGKTAINHASGKNLIGAFHQPRFVAIDVSTLSTLPRRELVAGLAEVIKYGIVFDDAFLGWLEAKLPALLALDEAALTHAVRRACEIKAEVVAVDEREEGRRAWLNFGHTFAHAIETATGYGTWLHGEAVGCGMVLAGRLSERLGLIDAARAARIERVVGAAGLPLRPPAIDTATLVALMRSDKKASDGEQRYIVLTGDGASLMPAADALVGAVIDELRT